ncbi:helix-turn-helix domain-containing protein [Paraburkholderia pallida]|uniref:HTH iclR-type domain-containing protein n=1 Tax=Paraburkholderia pallida TaxID=2547399 RepID=A0A4P7D805_9BURK|nr:helix-turn-helix domain-containing protein [Paraburkholderia pallida]QBR04328.1 hypothetical protein E1956_45305 [Paraburkholderia pallida]
MVGDDRCDNSRGEFQPIPFRPIYEGKAMKAESKNSPEQEEQADDQRPGIQSVEIGAEIMTALVTFGRAVPLRQLAAKCGMPVGKVHRYLVSLTRAGLVEQDSAGGHYGRWQGLNRDRTLRVVGVLADEGGRTGDCTTEVLTGEQI